MSVIGLSAVALFASIQSNAQILFSDDFETNSASQWAIYGGGNGLTITNDYSVVFNYNYSTQTFARVNGQMPFIPPAPNSGGTTHGLRVTANKKRTSGARIAAVSLYPKGMVFSNNYALRFDMFMDYNGGGDPQGGIGSTEYSTFGINHLGTKVNWFTTKVVSGYSAADWPGDGVWFMVDGEAGTDLGTNPGDYAAYVGDLASGLITALNSSNGGFLYDQAPNPLQSDPTIQPISEVFPVPPGNSWGAPGKQWVQVEINQIDGVVTWKMNGYVIASHSNVNGFTSGDIMIGYNDPLSGVAAEPNHVIFDNVRVVNLGTGGALPTVRLTPTDFDAAEPSDPASFTLERVDKDGNPGDATNPLTVNLSLTGTASNGVDFVSIPTSFVLPAGVQSTNVLITPINDGLGEPNETVIVRVLGSTNYDVRASFSGTFNIADDGDITSANLELVKSIAYENKRDGKVSVFLSGPAPGNVTVNYTLTGTATNGVHYVTIPGSQIIAAGNTNAIISVTPVDDGVINPDRTVTFTLTSGSGYAVGSSSNATVTIRNDDLVGGTISFSDNFDSDTTANWNINKSQSSDIVTFGYDYSVIDGIPKAPHTTNGTTKGLKLEANVTAAVAAGISLSPKNGNYTGDYRIRFDAWINYPGDLAGGSSDSTEWIAAGVGTTGDHAILPALGDGIWFDADGDGSSTVAADFEAFRGTTSLLVGAANDPWVGHSQASASSYFAEFGNEIAPQPQIDAGQSGSTYTGSLGFAWHDMVITKQGTNVTWSVDGLPFAAVATNGATLSTNVFIGYYDGSANINALPQFAFVIFDNFRVENLSVSAAQITGIRISGPNAVISFTGAAGDSSSAFTVQSSSTVNGTYANDLTANITGSSGSYQATIAVNGTTRFYRIKR